MENNSKDDDYGWRSLHSRHCSRCFIHINSLNFPNSPLGIIIISTSSVWKLDYREVKVK